MKNFIKAATLSAFALTAYAGLGTTGAKACVAVGQPQIEIQLDGRGNGRAIISEYDCGMMVQKTQCIVGVRLSDVALDERRITIGKMRFIRLADNSLLPGFQPEPNQNTKASWSKVMEGSWYGFSATYDARPVGKGGLGIEIAFTYDPAMTETQITKAFDMGHVGLAEGDPVGRIARGHMLEIVQIQGARIKKS